MGDAGTFLCTAVSRGDFDLIKRVLCAGTDPNSSDYDHRTPLHVAASQGLYLIAKLLLESGASVLSRDRFNLFITTSMMKLIDYHSFSSSTLQHYLLYVLK